MKIKLLLTIMLALLFTFNCNLIVMAQDAPTEKAPAKEGNTQNFKEKFSTDPVLNNLKNIDELSILQNSKGNVVSQKVQSDVYMLGKTNSNSEIISDLTIIVFTEGQPTIVTKLPKRYQNIHTPSFRLNDVSNDQLDDIIVSMPIKDGNDKTDYVIYTCKNGKAHIMFPHSKVFMAFKARFEPDYHIFIALNTVRKTTLDVSAKKEQYDKLGIYKDGRVVTDSKPYSYLTSIKPFANNNNYYSLECKYNVLGTSDEDVVARIRAVIFYNTAKQMWQLRSASVTAVK